MTKEFIYNYLKQNSLAVISTCSKKNKPEAALIGIAVTEDLVNLNIMENPFVVMVIGWDDETTVQYEGKATLFSGKESENLKEIYFGVYKDGRHRADSWPDLVHFKVSPNWIRYSNFKNPIVIEEMIDLIVLTNT